MNLTKDYFSSIGRGNKKPFLLLMMSLCCLLISTNISTAQDCNCAEFIYLNETHPSGAVHKYRIETDGTFTEITNAGGTAWYPGTGTTELSNPHGLVADLNGNLYIGEHVIVNSTNDIRRLNCDGDITPESVYKIDRSGFNFGSIGNVLYTNPMGTGLIEAYDLCTGDLINSICLTPSNDSNGNWVDQNWGLSISSDSMIYVTAGSSSSLGPRLWKIDPADFGGSTCVSPWLSADPTDTDPGLNDMFLPNTSGNYSTGRGVIAPGDGFVYYVEFFQSSSGNNESRIHKYNLAGEWQAATPWDTADDGSGYNKAHGIVYSHTTGYLYVSTTALNDDCVYAIDPATMTPVNAAVPSSGSDSRAKGIAILTECCPANNNMTVDTTLCAASLNDNIFLQDLINCSGTICEGLWQEGGSNTGLTYNSCNNSITIDALTACGSFTLESDGTGNNPQCGAFVITVNIDVLEAATITIVGDQTLCPDDTPTDLVATSSSATVTYQWQMSTSSCAGPWTDVSGATSSAYTPPVPSVVTYYQVVAAESGTCSGGSCDAESNCVTITPGTDCCPTENCLGITVTKN